MFLLNVFSALGENVLDFDIRGSNLYYFVFLFESAKGAATEADAFLYLEGRSWPKKKIRSYEICIPS